jgi:hypothetical protein
MDIVDYWQLEFEADYSLLSNAMVFNEYEFAELQNSILFSFIA